MRDKEKEISDILTEFLPELKLSEKDYARLIGAFGAYKHQPPLPSAGAKEKTEDQIWSGIMMYGWDRKRFENELKDYAQSFAQVSEKYLYDKANKREARGWFEDNEGNFYVDLDPNGLDMGGKITIRGVSDNHPQYEVRSRDKQQHPSAPTITSVITNEEIDRLSKVKYPGSSHGDMMDQYGFMANIKWLRDLSGEHKGKESGWIKCSDRLPTKEDADKYGEVLIWIGAEGEECWHKASYNTMGFKSTPPTIKIWQSLPEPPK